MTASVVEIPELVKLRDVEGGATLYVRSDVLRELVKEIERMKRVGERGMRVQTTLFVRLEK